ncbi:MAG: single-stranded DNA-binding protein [Candidatus Levybacteria bacterium]|nr:single-stranded DNA-binding protein [Candidatus Levybacteria bacterium]
MARSLNRVQLIGNLTRDPELRYTPQGTAVCSFGLATNRSWTTDTGEKKDEAEFHRIVAWNKLAELCSQFLTKGKKVFVEGRLSTRTWSAQDGTQKSTTEIIISDMILLDSMGTRPAVATEKEEAEEAIDAPKEVKKKAKKEEKEEAEEAPSEPTSASEEVAPDDIPF